MAFFTLKVNQVVKNIPDVITICFKQPALKKVKYKAGQYLTIIVRVNGRKYIRPYSFSSAPGVDELLEITVKRIPGGIVSNYLYDHLQIDDIIEVMQPMGSFIYDAADTIDEKHIMLWGAGSGITPLMSILKTALFHHPGKKISLFYCNRNPEHTIFYNELEQLTIKHSNFTVYNFYTRIPEGIYLNYFINGRINEEKIISILTNNNDLENTTHYICGPTGLKEVVKNALLKLEIEHANILTEDFEVLIDPEQFDDIQTQKITLTDGTENWNLEVIKGKSILNAGLDELIDLPYSCQTGTCLLCKAKLISGKLKVIGVTDLPDGLLDDEYLLCCSYPHSDDIKILVNKNL